jgi:ribokinase
VRPRPLVPLDVFNTYPHIVLHKGANFSLSDPPAQGDVERHLMGMSHLLLQNEIPWATILAFLKYAHARGLVTIFNPSPMPLDIQLQAFPWVALSWLIVNEGEAGSLLRVIGGNHRYHEFEGAYPANWPDDNNIRSAFSTLNRLCLGEHLASTSIVCTLGAAGVLASIRGLGETLYFPAAALEGNVRDTTGAGDCFTGYFVASLMRFGSKQLSKDDAVELLRLSVQVCLSCSGQFISTQQSRRLGCA